MFSKRRKGIALRTAVRGPGYQGSRHGEVHYLDCSAILDGGRLSVFATNRSQDEEMDLTVEMADRSIALPESAELLTGADAKAANSFAAPDVIQREVFEGIEIRGGRAHASLPPLSLLAATLELEG